MESELQGRLRNTHLPASQAAIPLFEAVVNSIQACEDNELVTGRPLREHRITVRILRLSQDHLGQNLRGQREPIVGFEITDEGIGFTDGNFQSFSMLDSLFKAKRGCRGIGRLMWLKAFRRVTVDSIFQDDDGLKRRTFRFDPAKGVDPDGDPTHAEGLKRTTVHLDGFEAKYVEKCPTSADGLATGLLEHCLWYFVRDQGVPTIFVNDVGESLNLDTLYDDHMHASALAELDLEIKGQPFTVTHVKFRVGKRRVHSLNYCAGGRVVKEEPIQTKVPGLVGTLRDDRGAFTYAAYLTSTFLDERSTAQRIGFNIEDEVDGLMAATDISFRDIRTAVLPRVRKFLSISLDQNVAAAKERVASFVSTKAPRYRPILGHIPEEELIVDPSISDASLDALLHKHLFNIEESILAEGHAMMAPGAEETEDTYRTRLDGYLQKVADLKRSDLANYVAHRRVIIDLLAKAIERRSDGRYAREDMIHQLIVPMQITSNDIAFRRQSLWLLDERLAFHDYLASDKPIGQMPITTSRDAKEPDVAMLRVFDNPILVSDKADGPGASITVIEIKRPMRGGFRAGQDEERDPILQALDYLKRLRQGSMTSIGRPIPNADKIPGFVYIVADLTPKMRECCELYQLKPTADGMGYFGYHGSERYNAYIQIMSFDGLVVSAKERNRAFFDRLGLPTH